MSDGFGPEDFTPPPGPGRILARYLAWTLTFLLAAAAILGAGYWLGAGERESDAGPLAVATPSTPDGKPVQDPALIGLSVLFALDLADSAEIDVRFSADGPAPQTPRPRFILEFTARQEAARLHLTPTIRDPRTNTIVWTATISATGEDFFPAMAETIRRANTLLRRDRRFQHGAVPRPEEVTNRLARDLAASARALTIMADSAAWSPAGTVQLIRMLELAANFDPADPAIASRLASRLALAVLERHVLDNDPLDRAADQLTRATTAAPTHPDTFLARCHVRRAQLRHDEAIEACEAARALLPSPTAATQFALQAAPIMVEIAHNHLELWHTEDALRWYMRALELEPEPPAAIPTWRGLAIAHYLGGNREQAAHFMGLAAAARPADPVARGWHAALLALAGRRGEAEREATAFFALPAIPPRRPGTLPRLHLLAEEFGGRHGLIEDTLAELRSGMRNR